MRKLLLMCAMAVMLTGLLAACGGQNDSPRSVAKAAVSYMEKKDYKGYMSLTNATDQQKEAMVQMLEKVGKDGDSKGGLKSYEILDEEVDEAGGKATVSLKIVYENGEEKTEKMKMVKQDGKWYLSADK